MASLVVLVSACSSAGSAAGGDSNAGHSVTSTAETPAAPIAAEDFLTVQFNQSTTIDNRYFPLRPGTQFIYEGSSVDDGERLEHSVVFTVTDLTKVINGVRVVVVWDRDYTEGELEETELAFFAQDDGGNVWHLGQYPEEYDGKKFIKAPAWIAGFEGATAGITMHANPQLGDPDYAEGYAPPPINWIDRARVYEIGEHTCAPAGCYDDVLVTEEFEVDKPGAFQLKYYAPRVGNVRVGWRGRNEKERETLQLVELRHLTTDELAKVREQALELEARAYEVSKAVYGRTLPAE